MFDIYTVPTNTHFPDLKEIPSPPEKLYVRGILPPENNVLLTIVGSRRYTDYGKAVLNYLVGGLKNYPITIVSGLAIGIDSIAHKAALDNSLHTIAVPGSGISDEVIYPRLNFNMAKEILNNGGAILSEFKPKEKAAPWMFPKRNRIMAGISKATLMIEAEEKSGTLITARLVSDFNRELMIVPGSIFSPQSKGTHQFAQLGASLVTSPKDILDLLGFKNSKDISEVDDSDFSDNEKMIYEILKTSSLTRDGIIEQTKLSAEIVNQALTMLEIREVVNENMGRFHLTVRN